MENLIKDIRYGFRSIIKRPGFSLVATTVAGTLVLVALVACLVPARRATKVDPLVALRYE